MPLCRNAENRTASLTQLIVAVIILTAAQVALATSSLGQSTPDAPSSQTVSQTTHGSLFTLAQRSLFFPDIAATPGPLSPGAKFKLFAANSVSISVLLESAVSSSISQATNSPEGYGQGGDGYGKRFGAMMARRSSSEFFGTFVLASALHQDPRFFPEKNPTFKSSIKYSIERLFVTRTDSGRDVANWSGLMGPLLAEGLANSYWPEQNRTAGETFERYGFDLATRAGTNLLRNYWPVFFKRLRGSSLPAGSH